MDSQPNAPSEGFNSNSAINFDPEDRTSVPFRSGQPQQPAVFGSETDRAQTMAQDSHQSAGGWQSFDFVPMAQSSSSSSSSTGPPGHQATWQLGPVDAASSLAASAPAVSSAPTTAVAPTHGGSAVLAVAAPQTSTGSGAPAGLTPTAASGSSITITAVTGSSSSSSIQQGVLTGAVGLDSLAPMDPVDQGLEQSPQVTDTPVSSPGGAHSNGSETWCQSDLDQGRYFKWPAAVSGQGGGSEGDDDGDIRVVRIPIGPDPMTGAMRYRYKCHCGSTFKSMGQLRAHARYKHKSGRACQCPCCGLRLAQPGNAVRHLQTQHPGVRPYVCKACGATFLSHFKMLKHRRLAHNIEAGRQGYISVDDINLSVCPAAAAAASGVPFVLGDTNDAVRTAENRKRGGQRPSAALQQSSMPTLSKSTKRKPTTTRRPAAKLDQVSALQATFSRSSTSGRKRKRSRKAAQLDVVGAQENWYDDEEDRDSYDSESSVAGSRKTARHGGGMTSALAQLAESAKEVGEKLGPLPKGVNLLQSATLDTASGTPVSLARLVSVIPPGYVLAPRSLLLGQGELAAERGIIDPEQLRYLAAGHLVPAVDSSPTSMPPPPPSAEALATVSKSSASSAANTILEPIPAVGPSSGSVPETAVPGATTSYVLERLVFVKGEDSEMKPVVLPVEAVRVAIPMEHHWPDGVVPSSAPDPAAIVRSRIAAQSSKDLPLQAIPPGSSASATNPNVLGASASVPSSSGAQPLPTERTSQGLASVGMSSDSTPSAAAITNEQLSLFDLATATSTGRNASDPSARKWQCPTCLRKFRSSSNLKRHRMSVHGQKLTRTCFLCSARFCDEHDLGPHLSTKHGLPLTEYELEFGAQERAGITSQTSPGDRVLVMKQMGVGSATSPAIDVGPATQQATSSSQGAAGGSVPAPGPTGQLATGTQATSSGHTAARATGKQASGSTSPRPLPLEETNAIGPSPVVSMPPPKVPSVLQQEQRSLVQTAAGDATAESTEESVRRFESMGLPPLPADFMPVTSDVSGAGTT